MAEIYTTTGVFRYIGNADNTSSTNSNLDAWYGPYNSITDALVQTQTIVNTMTGVTRVVRYIGLTVGIIDSQGHVSEYWFKNGIEDNDLIPKIPDIDAILGNIKVAKFDKNGGFGHMNSILSDEEGYVKLPVCTFTNPNGLFQGWSTTSGGDSLHNEGDEVPLTQATKFFAIWSGMISYTVSWTDGVSPDLAYAITAMADNNPIGNGDSVVAGSTVVLTCTTQHYVSAWNGLPTGAVVSGNTVTVNNLAQNLNVSCVVAAFVGIRFHPSPTYGHYTVSYDWGSPVTVSGPWSASVPEGSSVEVTYVPESGYNASAWDVTSGGNAHPYTQSQNKIMFTMPSDVVNIGVTESTDSFVMVNFYKDTERVDIIESVTVQGESATLQDMVDESDYVKNYPPTGYTWSPKKFSYCGSTDEIPTSTPLSAGTYDIWTNGLTRNQHTVSASASPMEGGTVSGTGTYYYGDTATLTATANTGYVFSHWDNNTSDANQSKTITVTQNESYVAHFAAAQPDQVNTIELSGMKKYASNVQDRIDNGTITSTPYTRTIGQENMVAIVRNNDTNDTKGYSVLLPQGYKVNESSVHFYDQQGNEFDKIQYQVTCTHGLPSSSLDGSIVTQFTYNGGTYQGYFMSLDANAPTTVKFTIELE